MKFYRIILFLNIFLLFASCGTLKEGFKNQKKNNSDEFLVEKKSPLVMPPDFEDLPKPENDKSESSADNEIKLFKSDGEQKSNKNAISKDIEGSILEKIKSN